MVTTTTPPARRKTTNFKAVYDADLIVNLEEKLKESSLSEDKLNKIFDTAFLTKAGRELAEKVLKKEMRLHREVVENPGLSG